MAVGELEKKSTPIINRTYSRSWEGNEASFGEYMSSFWHSVNLLVIILMERCQVLFDIRWIEGLSHTGMFPLSGNDAKNWQKFTSKGKRWPRLTQVNTKKGNNMASINDVKWI